MTTTSRARRYFAAAAFAAAAFCSFATTSAMAREPTDSASAEDVAAVRAFARRFYSWYVPAATGKDPKSLLQTSQMRAAVAPDLLARLQSDSEAQGKEASGDLVGLDFDPFLASQDPCDRYDAGRVTRRGPVFAVEIHGAGGCSSHDGPDLVADVSRHEGSWRFVNFHYPGQVPTDLLTLLDRLREDRRKSAPAPRPPGNPSAPTAADGRRNRRG